MTNKNTDVPLVYSCSGCSNVAQLANDVAVVLDREGHAQMSCIAGVGGNVKGLVKIAKSGRPILAIDGCRIACVKNVLGNHEITPRWHLELSSLGLKKIEHQSCSVGDMHKALSSAHKLLASTKSDLPTKG
ncbi:putative zinc-binding protein [Cellvibrio sp. OA-2007]|uniref:putative zinc-binding protein n=1 Tax=Cellvibrio sp. OA-2007 TaxID=529823 RepID=UPI00078253A2|nr:putative zinc-binding protein [Cellvibrio sp. OA-2007]